MKETQNIQKWMKEKNIIFKNEWKNKKTWQVEKNIQIEWKELKTRKNKKNDHKIHKNKNGEKLSKHK